MGVEALIRDIEGVVADAAAAASQPAVLPGVSGSALPINAGEASLQEGWIKVRGIPFTATKQDLMAFFSVCPSISLPHTELNESKNACIFVACSPKLLYCVRRGARNSQRTR